MPRTPAADRVRTCCESLEARRLLADVSGTVSVKFGAASGNIADVDVSDHAVSGGNEGLTLKDGTFKIASGVTASLATMEFSVGAGGNSDVTYSVPMTVTLSKTSLPIVGASSFKSTLTIHTVGTEMAEDGSGGTDIDSTVSVTVAYTSFPGFTFREADGSTLDLDFLGIGGLSKGKFTKASKLSAGATAFENTNGPGSESHDFDAIYQFGAKLGGAETPQPAGNIAVTGLRWDEGDNSTGGMDLTVAASGVTVDVPIEVSWAAAANNGAQRQAIAKAGELVTLPDGTKTINIDGSTLQDAPTWAKYLRVYVDPANVAGETAANRNDNYKFLGDVVVKASPDVKAKNDRFPISEKTYAVIKNLLREVGHSYAYITESGRSAEDQANIMFDNSFNKTNATYAAAGKAIIALYKKKTKGLNRAQILRARDSIVDAMTDAITSTDGGARKVSKHIASAAQWRALNVVDIGPNSSNFPQAARDLFELDATLAASEGKLDKYIGPSQGDAAFHLQIAQ